MLLCLSIDTFRLILKPKVQLQIDNKNKFLKSLLGYFCNLEDVWRISPYFDLQELEKNSVFLTEKDPFDKVYVVAEGEVTLYKKIFMMNKEKQQAFKKTLRKISCSVVIYGEGQFFGLKEFKENLAHFFFEARATENTKVYGISVENLRKCLIDFSSFEHYFQDICMRQLRKLNVT